jgi:PucR family transcriptional regulator, purine catabolism regulatory protein
VVCTNWLLVFVLSHNLMFCFMARDGLITVEDLLRSPALQLRLIAGEAGVTRRVAWAHVSELEDPTPWLFGSEMIMTTGMALPRSAAGQRSYLARLDDAGVACLAVSERMFVPPLTSSFFAAAAARGFPVVEVPIPVPFMAISQEVAAAVAPGGAGQRLNAQLQVFGAVQWLASGTLSAAEIFARLERLSGYTLYACTRGRAPLLEGLRVPPPEYADLIPDAVTSPPTVPGGYVLPVTGPRGTAGYLLAMESPSAAPAGVSVVQHIATVAALQLSMLAHEREMLRRSGAETLAEMLQGLVEGAVVTRRLAGNGFLVDRLLRLAVVPGSADDDRVADVFAGAGLPCFILRQQDELLVLLQDGEADRAALTGAVAAAGGGSAAVGFSRPFAAGGASVAVARREARWALARAAEAGRPWVSYGEDRTEKWLTSETAELRALASQVLGAVLAYDAEHSGDLVPSVRVWLEHDRQTDRAARALHIHPNTLLYRIRRFEQISGRSLASTEALAEVWLAMRTTAAVPPG